MECPMGNTIYKAIHHWLVAFTVVLALCASVASAGLLDGLGGIANGMAQRATEQALKRAQREAAYLVIESGLRSAGVRGYQHFVSAIRAVVEKNDMGEATAAFLAGLDECGTDQGHYIIKTLYALAIGIRLSHPEVSRETVSFLNYIASHCNFGNED